MAFNMTIRTIILFFVLTIGFSACEELEEILPAELTEEEVVEGLRSALRVGTDTSVSRLNVLNGYLGDELVRIALPPEAAIIEDAINIVPGLGEAAINETKTLMNRAAENAAEKAKPIFVNAITNISIEDGFNILYGDSIAATRYLQVNTSDSLNDAFKPDINKAMTSVGVQQVWEPLANTYNSYVDLNPFDTLNSKVPIDLSQHVTDRALYGLFLKVGDEEQRIREDPVARVNDILQKVFGELDN